MTRAPRPPHLLVKERVDNGFMARAVETVADAVEQYSSREREPKLPVR